MANKLLQEKIEKLNDDILAAADEGNSDLISQKVETKKSIQSILSKREDAESNFIENNLNTDELYIRLKEAKDEFHIRLKEAEDDENIQKMKDRTMTEKEYKVLSNQYDVNSDVVEFNSENNIESIEEREGDISKFQERGSEYITNLEKGGDFIFQDARLSGLQAKTCANKQEYKEELQNRCNLWMKKYVSHGLAPTGKRGFTTTIKHPERKNNTPQNFYEGNLEDYNDITGNTEENNGSRTTYTSFGQKKLGVRLNSIRNHGTDPDKLPDKIKYNGRKDDNHTKKYLQEMKKVIPNYSMFSTPDMKEWMKIIGEDIGLPEEQLGKRYSLYHAVLHYIMNALGVYHTDDKGACVNFDGSNRWFDSDGRESDNRALFFSRAG